MAAKIRSFNQITPMIYAYNTPGVTYHEGWTKIGYTAKQTVEERIRQQTHTPDIHTVLAWQDFAMFKKAPLVYFNDHAFHDYLTIEAGIERQPDTEWFKVDGSTSRALFDKFTMRQGVDPSRACATYVLRQEQEQAAERTRAYFAGGGEEFLWNAKPRFGKTLTAYDLVLRAGFRNVLILTNRPSVSNSWADDFRKFIGWKEDYRFVSDNDALRGRPDVLTREEYVALTCSSDDDEVPGMIAFESLQGLKGSVFFGGQYDKLKWIYDFEFDLLIVDESQEGVDTVRADRAFDNIRRKHTLYLSGTPFKQLASDQFSDEQIFNWSYADEQEAKENWSGDDYNPYEELPRLAMFTYQLSPMIREQVEKGCVLPDDGDTVDYAFDLNEFFATKADGTFAHEEDVKKFLHALSTQEKYPFSTPELRNELKHTMWFLNRVASAKALSKLLHDDPVFGEYEVVVAAGDGRENDDDKVIGQSFDRVKKAIAEHDKTITLTVGQLTVGITIPEWSGVLMLCNLKSPSSYMQAAFRAQNPCEITVDGKRLRKEMAYVFDFDPARTLIIFDEFANNLLRRTVDGRGTSDDRKENIKRLLNFFPVLGEDDEGRMVELDAAQVLSIPRKIKSQEVVRRGFMSNFLFRNISNIFGAPDVVRQIVEKIAPAQEEKKRSEQPLPAALGGIRVDESGSVEIPTEIVIGKANELFGDKIYETVGEDVENCFTAIGMAEDEKAVSGQVKKLKELVTGTICRDYIAPTASEYGITKKQQERLEKEVRQEMDAKFEKLQGDYEQQRRIAQAELAHKRSEASSEEEVVQAEADCNSRMESILQDLVSAARVELQKAIQDRPADLVERMEREKAEREKDSIEDKVRDHLRGFSRTIPSFLMAYGDENICLANFDDYTEEDVFLEVTGITENDFRFLRDGGDRVNEETGETEHFEGHLFDEIVFDDSVKEFLKKKDELADYFDESHDEDIFDYIPPQKTNQIFTPRKVVEQMVDSLEENNPGCFDDSRNTFADLYMKSGLYITEIVKRLYRSEAIKAEYPDDKERIRHILQKQVYGMAPSRIIYLIATNYILGFDPELKSETRNFVQADAAEAAKSGKLQQLVDEKFGE